MLLNDVLAFFSFLCAAVILLLLWKPLLRSIILQSFISRIHPKMAEEKRVKEDSIETKQPKKLLMPNLLESIKNQPLSPSAQPRSARYNCLCAPTTHAGSFRCRYHRTASLSRNSMSVGSRLSELAAEK